MFASSYFTLIGWTYHRLGAHWFTHNHDAMPHFQHVIDLTINQRLLFRNLTLSFPLEAEYNFRNLNALYPNFLLS
jgi:hypothetical protein